MGCNQGWTGVFKVAQDKNSKAALSGFNMVCRSGLASRPDGCPAQISPDLATPRDFSRRPSPTLGVLYSHNFFDYIYYKYIILAYYIKSVKEIFTFCSLVSCSLARAFDEHPFIHSFFFLLSKIKQTRQYPPH